MSRCKQVTVQAKIDGELVFDRTIDGKTRQRSLFMECLYCIDRLGGTAVVRTQTVGARSWAVYSYTAGNTVAHLDQSLEF